MLQDIVLANIGLVIGWVVCFIVLVGIHFLTRRGATEVAISTGEKEMLTAHSTTMGWVWTIFFTITVLSVLIVATTQSVNYVPRQTEDRSGAESDQQKFERRIQEKQKQSQK